MERKAAIRKELLERRDRMPEAKQRADNEAILKSLFRQPRFLQAQEIYTYVSFGSEADTRRLVEICLEKRKTLYCPKILGKGRMEFYPISSFEELEEGYRGILEPPMPDIFQPKEEKRVPKDGALMLMPLVGFDRNNNRLGYGGGYYDRYLEDKPQLFTIALAFEEQYWEPGLVTDDFDIPPKMILTPKRCLEIN
ncbi:MAG: 5-formyltetrahydrofolate cyclo-ligase [Lachnospiraceae bacterium]